MVDMIVHRPSVRPKSLGENQFGNQRCYRHGNGQVSPPLMAEIVALTANLFDGRQKGRVETMRLQKRCERRD